LRPTAGGADSDRIDATVRPPAWPFVAPAAVLAVATAAFGVAPTIWSGLIDDAAQALDDDAHAHLTLWHGFNTPLVLSLCTIAAGLGIFLARRPFDKLQAAIAPVTTGAAVYDSIVRAVLRFAAWVTRVVQSGSLRIYATVIMTTAAVAPLVALTTGNWWPGWPDAVGRAGHLPIAALLGGAGLAATLARRRFAAALLLGVVGYGMAILFVAQGAPDLALTQFSIETLSTVVFLLVLRQLPDRFDRPAPLLSRALRLTVAGAVGVFVSLMAIAAAGSRTARPVSLEMSEQALPEGYGRNIVNVILVDIRGMDTMGEITVLVAAGLGIVSIARLGRRPRRWTTGRPGGRRRTFIGRRRPTVRES
jgi:multicomponent Na+:H+ antiporter subunit A